MFKCFVFNFYNFSFELFVRVAAFRSTPRRINICHVTVTESETLIILRAQRQRAGDSPQLVHKCMDRGSVRLHSFGPYPILPTHHRLFLAGDAADYRSFWPSLIFLWQAAVLVKAYL